MAERYTSCEVRRILGLQPGRLRYWERLQLVRPRTRWRERFYSFSDLIALRSLKYLTENRIPARRVRRALAAWERWERGARVPLAQLRLFPRGREVALIPPGLGKQPLEPLSGQWLLPFEFGVRRGEIRRMISPSAEQWFEYALECDSQPEKFAEAAGAYRRVLELEPGWIEAHINLGVALYHLFEFDEARRAFEAALVLESDNVTAHFNLGCVFEEMGDLEEALEHLRSAVRTDPGHSDAHFNLALAYEKCGEPLRAREHWTHYLRCEPKGSWADYARARISPVRRTGPPIPFPGWN
ncbi:MAG: tetratricopeptide repeat protein [Candidatus Acidiferrales bacterium]